MKKGKMTLEMKVVRGLAVGQSLVLLLTAENNHRFEKLADMVMLGISGFYDDSFYANWRIAFSQKQGRIYVEKALRILEDEYYGLSRQIDLNPATLQVCLNYWLDWSRFLITYSSLSEGGAFAKFEKLNEMKLTSQSLSKYYGDRFDDVIEGFQSLQNKADTSF